MCFARTANFLFYVDIARKNNSLVLEYSQKLDDIENKYTNKFKDLEENFKIKLEDLKKTYDKDSQEIIDSKEKYDTDCQYMNSEYLKEKCEIEDSLDEFTLHSIIYSVLALEAYIFDYAARNLGDSFTKETLDKLDIVNKYVLIPKLITGTYFDKGCEAFSLLKQLVKSRNNLVHNKSKKVPVDDKEKFFNENQKRSDELLSIAKISSKALDLIAEEINRIDPNEHSLEYLNHSTKSSSALLNKE